MGWFTAAQADHQIYINNQMAVGDRTMISNWAKDEPIVVIIDNKEIAESYRNYFEILRRMTKP